MSTIADMGDFSQVGENLVRHKSGSIYLRAKVSGKVIRQSLGTSDLRIAKIKRDDLLTAIRNSSSVQNKTQGIRTLGDAVGYVSAQILAQPEITDGTARFYKDISRILSETLPIDIHARLWTQLDASKWWKKIATQFAAQRANHVLMLAKRVGKLLVSEGVRIDDPTANLKRVPIRQMALNVPTRDQIEAIIADIRSQRKAHSEEAANYVAFLAFAGCRISQADAFKWSNVKADWIEFPGGIKGTKGANTRRLPISPPLRDVLERLKKNRKGDEDGPVFAMEKPRCALTNVCKRLGIPHLRLHDLRHFFATYALECGVDVPTVSKWLGHKDGGVLVLKTYGHIRDDHSLQSANKLR